MIVSASRRCDIPAHYADWLMGRARAGYCLVASPYDAHRLTRVSLDPADVDFLVFWTRDPRPLAPRMKELDALGLHSYVHMTITGYPRELEPGAPSLAQAIDALCELSDLVGPERVLWRYDPILVARGIGPDLHRRTFERITAALGGRTRRVTLSLIDEYAATAGRLERAGFPEAVFGSPRVSKPEGTRAGHVSDVAQRELFEDESPPSMPPAAAAEGEGRALPPEPYPGLLSELAAMARARSIVPRSCAEPYDLEGLGIEAGACVDQGLAASIWGIEVPGAKDQGQRAACRCAPSLDIGAYGACPRGCAYCYANRGRGRLLERGPEDESL